MAEGGRSQQSVVNDNDHLMQERDTFNEMSSKTTDINAAEIDLNTPGQVDRGARDGEEREERNAQECGEASDYVTPTAQANQRMNIPGSEVQAFILEERASLLMEDSNFDEASFLLEELLKIPGQDALRIHLKMVECYLQIGRVNEAKDIISNIKTKMMTSPRPKFSDVLTLAENYQKNKHYIQALILYQCLCELFKLDASPDNAVSVIRSECICESANIVYAMVGEGARLHAIASDLAIPLMHNMLENLRQINVVNLDTKVEDVATCLCYIGCSYRKVGRPQEAINYEWEGLEIMKNQFGSNASKYEVLGLLLHNISLANEDLGNFRDAESFALQAIEAKKHATDCTNEEEREKSIELTKRSLKNTRDKMKI